MTEKSATSEKTNEKCPGDWRLESGNGGLPRLVLDRDGLQAEIYLNGAHLTTFENRQRGLSLFWMDPAADYVSGRAIRGGVPLVFPWFGPNAERPGTPNHGFARNMTWAFVGQARDGEASRAVLELQNSDMTKGLWPHAFLLRLEVEVAPSGVVMRLTTRNTDKTPFTFENALHSYFAVNDVRQIAVEGLDGKTYIDKTDNFQRRQQSGDVRLPKFTDSVFLDATETVVVREAGRPTLRIEKSGSRETVVWNPGPKKDGPDAVPPPFVCVEPANCADHPVTLQPGEEHTLEAKFLFEL